jgi:hypothetical protein
VNIVGRATKIAVNAVVLVQAQLHIGFFQFGFDCRWNNYRVLILDRTFCREGEVLDVV